MYDLTALTMLSIKYSVVLLVLVFPYSTIIILILRSQVVYFECWHQLGRKMLKNVTFGGLTEKQTMAKPLTHSQAAKHAAQEMDWQLLEEQCRLYEDLQVELMEAVAHGDALKERFCKCGEPKFDDQDAGGYWIGSTTSVRITCNKFLRLQSHLDAGGNRWGTHPSRETTIAHDSTKSTLERVCNTQ